MHTRPVRADELDLFVEAAGTPDHRKEVEQYLDSMFAASSIRPEWCFVTEKEGRNLGRVAFWTLPGMGGALRPCATGRLLGRRVYGCGQTLAQGYPGRSAQIGRQGDRARPRLSADAAPSSNTTRGGESSCCKAPGSPSDERPAASSGGEKEPPVVSKRLTFRTLEEVGAETFVEAMRRISEGTLDREIREEREKLGPQQAAREFFEDARRVKHESSWWRLAYTSEEDLAGLVMPAAPPAFLTIFYVGVVPEMRGRGYVDDLLAAGTVTAAPGSGERWGREALAGGHGRGKRTDGSRLRAGGMGHVSQGGASTRLISLRIMRRTRFTSRMTFSNAARLSRERSQRPPRSW